MPSAQSRRYGRTLLVDLRPEEAAVFANLGKTARQNIRVAGKRPVIVECAVDPSIAGRLSQLQAETWKRTGAQSRPIDWVSRIELSKAEPHLSRVCVLRRTDRKGSDAIIAYAWGCMHGQIAEYASAATATDLRRAGEQSIPACYPLVWDLMRWGRRNGAEWFDLGGVTAGTQKSADPLGGISDFKRYFTQNEVEVGQQWELALLPARVAIAQAASTLARRGAALIGGRIWGAACVSSEFAETLACFPV
ncbi:MAG: GNAT family N-acetyltransferase [Usitatibacteraceae bacterium]